LLRSNPVEEGQWPKPEPQALPSSAMPYFDVADEQYHGVEADLTPVFVPHPAPMAASATATHRDVGPSDSTMTPSLPFGDI
jgi:hypothetical protein